MRRSHQSGRRAQISRPALAFVTCGSDRAERLAEGWAGAGALTRQASAAGNTVLATDFSPGMVSAIAELRLQGVKAHVMDGHTLALPDNSFDAAFSMFGIMLFSDWAKGLAEMVRVLRPGGMACIGTWAEPSGAAANLLIANITAWKFPSLDVPDIVPGMTQWTDRSRFRAALEQAGLADLRFHEVTSDFLIEQGMLDEPDRLFQFSPVWPLLDGGQRAALLEELGELAARNDGRINVASPATIAIGRKAAV
jgi:SAM-dependent methyltransferase